MSAGADIQTAALREDRRRERELYRYYQPGSDDDPIRQSRLLAQQKGPLSPLASSPDTTLTALAQLVALRLNVSRCLISVIARQKQYTLCESTRTLDLIDSSKFEVAGDGLWLGCGDLDKNDGLCENTVKLPVVPGQHSYFIVPDLSKDKRFKDKFYVAEFPNWKFYAGTPLTTNRGINIGSLCVLDDKPRPGLTEEQRPFFAAIAHTIMKQMEVKREADERRKVTRMSRGLNAFVEGKCWLTPEGQLPEIGGSGRETLAKAQAPRPAGMSRTGRSSPGRSSSEPVSPTDQKKTSSDGIPKLDGSITSVEPEGTQDESENEVPLRGVDAGHKWTFARAANLLRESLDLQDGGVVFLDTTVGMTQNEDDSFPSPTGSFKPEEDQTPTSGSSYHRRSSTATTIASFAKEFGAEPNSKKADVLGCSTTENPMDPIDPTTKLDAVRIFNPLDEIFFNQILRRYPRGKLWLFEEDGGITSEEEEITPTLDSKDSKQSQQNKTKRKQLEAKSLQIAFPAARQLLFAPLWDAGQARWFSGCFCWTTTDRQVFSTDSELSYLTAFGNNIMAEVSRLATIAADQQKGDFIGSISHELRSPLHGILASAEFLSETDCDGFQRSLVDTIDSCGRTLLDTINHVLDFSKINTFERNWKKAQKSRNSQRSSSSITTRAGPAHTVSEGAPPLLNIYAVTDVASICEEVVEGIYAGQIYQNISSTDIADVSAATRGKVPNRGSMNPSRFSSGGSGSQLTEKPVEVILNIAQGDFTFITQPGALRRVIMNIFGNALKYTDRGMIVVKLELLDLDASYEPEARANGKLLNITVTDTGKGISDHYLRTRLFTPFAQENTLAPGTGLGLSLVRSIINMLNGTIEIRSQVGKGTEVRIALPLMRTSELATPQSTPSSAGTLDRVPDDSISILQARASGKSVALYGFEPKKTADPSTIERGRSLRNYVCDWYGLDVTPTWKSKRIPEIVIVDEKDLPKLRSEAIHESSVIVLCSNATRYTQTAFATVGLGAVEFVSKPFGPYKLAKALRLCLEKARVIRSGLTPITDTLIEEPMITESGALIADFEAVTLEGMDSSTPLFAQTNGVITASDSKNAQMTVRTPSEELAHHDSDKGAPEFPFPAQEARESDFEKVTSPGMRDDLVERDTRRPDLTSRRTDPYMKPHRRSLSSIESPSSGKKPEKAITQPLELNKDIPLNPTREKRVPKVLLVDDNKINLRLLQTFMAKRKYEHVDSAENGQLAVQAAEMQQDGYDIVFMDISMPVMNGFEATRAIRDLEESRRRDRQGAALENTPGDLSIVAPALVIALTGLASSRDQSEAFTSGVDLFMTKPVSFKEVGRLLDNWEANEGNPRYKIQGR